MPAKMLSKKTSRLIYLSRVICSLPKKKKKNDNHQHSPYSIRLIPHSFTFIRSLEQYLSFVFFSFFLDSSTLFNQLRFRFSLSFSFSFVYFVVVWCSSVYLSTYLSTLFLRFFFSKNGQECTSRCLAVQKDQWEHTHLIKFLLNIVRSHRSFFFLRFSFSFSFSGFHFIFLSLSWQRRFYAYVYLFFLLQTHTYLCLCSNWSSFIKCPEKQTNKWFLRAWLFRWNNSPNFSSLLEKIFCSFSIIDYYLWIRWNEFIHIEEGEYTYRCTRWWFSFLEQDKNQFDWYENYPIRFVMFR